MKNAERSSIGARRLLYLPYLMGERTPHLDPDARGAFVGLSSVHTRGDMTRAVMEGVCYSQADSLSVLREMGADVSDMLVCGGGAKSKLWRQMLSDVYGIPCSRTESDEGPALGAAILAMVSVGLYSSVTEACDAVVRVRDRVEPKCEDHEAYMKFYEIYKRLYSHLKDDFSSLAKL